MHILGKPKNQWGWLRVAGWAVLAGVGIWVILAAVLRSMGGVSWMAWSGYQTFSPLNGLELAALPLLGVVLAGWLEEQDHRSAAEQSHQREAERAAAEQRKITIKHLHEAILGVLPKHDPTQAPAQARLQAAEIVRAALAELDGKGKGELLHFLFEKELVSGEAALVDLNGADFSGLDANKAHLHGLCLEGVDLTNARMNGAHLVKCRLGGVNLSRAFLRHADLREAGLAGSNLQGAHLENANLEDADLSDACLEGAFLMNANLKNAQMRLGALDQALLIETILPDGRKVTNDRGKEYLRNQEIALVVDRL